MLSNHVARHVALHRGLGLEFNEQERLLELFAEYAEAHEDACIQTKRVHEWCASASFAELRENQV